MKANKDRIVQLNERGILIFSLKSWENYYTNPEYLISDSWFSTNRCISNLFLPIDCCVVLPPEKDSSYKRIFIL